jgi:hypothetical protein
MSQAREKDNVSPATLHPCQFEDMEQDEKFEWTVLPLPPYSQHLAPSDSLLFGPVKDGLRGQHFLDYAVIAAVSKWVASAGADFYERSIQAPVHRWRKCILSGGDYVERQSFF